MESSIFSVEEQEIPEKTSGKWEELIKDFFSSDSYELDTSPSFHIAISSEVVDDSLEVFRLFHS